MPAGGGGREREKASQLPISLLPLPTNANQKEGFSRLWPEADSDPIFAKFSRDCDCGREKLSILSWLRSKSNRENPFVCSAKRAFGVFLHHQVISRPFHFKVGKIRLG